MSRHADIEAALRQLAPRIPKHEFGHVMDHARDSPRLQTARQQAAA